MNAPSGPTSQTPFAYFDLESSCWRMSQLSLDLSFSESPTVWPRSGMTCNGLAYGRPLSELPTAGNGSLLLPSPVAQQSGNPPAAHLRKKPGRQQVTDLAIIVENGLLETGGLLPTPRATDGTKGGPNQRGSKGDLMLPSAVMEL